MAPKAAKGKAPPKGKAAPKSKPDAKAGGEGGAGGPPPGEEEEFFDIQDINPLKNVPTRKIYSGLTTISVLSIIVIAVSIHICKFSSTW